MKTATVAGVGVLTALVAGAAATGGCRREGLLLLLFTCESDVLVVVRVVAGRARHLHVEAQS
jgi:hypothetical protein